MTRPVSDNETFITLMRVAREDPEIRQSLTAILSLDSFNRKSLLASWAMDMKRKGAPEDFVQAILYLRDDEVANQAAVIIRGLD